MRQPDDSGGAQLGEAGCRAGTRPEPLELAYRYLSRRERTVEEVRRHLIGHAVDQAGVEAAIAALIERGYLDDERFARLFVQDKRSLEQWGSERIGRDLEARGIDREVVEAALAHEAEAEGGGDLERALALLRRRFPSPSRERRERDRALGVLIRKGYDSELALDALRRHLASASRDASARG